MKSAHVRAARDRAGVLERALGRFLDHLSTGDLAIATRATAEGFTWFGRPVARFESFARFRSAAPLSWKDIRLVPRELVLDAEATGGALALNEQLFLVDIVRAELAVTAAVVVREGDPPSIVRVFDPARLAKALGAYGR